VIPNVREAGIAAPSVESRGASGISFTFWRPRIRKWEVEVLLEALRELRRRSPWLC